MLFEAVERSEMSRSFRQLLWCGGCRIALQERLWAALPVEETSRELGLELCMHNIESALSLEVRTTGDCLSLQPAQGRQCSKPLQKASQSGGMAFRAFLKPRGPPIPLWEGAPVAWISCFVDAIFAFHLHVSIAVDFTTGLAISQHLL